MSILQTTVLTLLSTLTGTAEMNTDQHAIIQRIKRKAEIMRLDLKATNNPKYKDAGEILSLIDLLERM